MSQLPLTFDDVSGWHIPGIVQANGRKCLTRSSCAVRVSPVSEGLSFSCNHAVSASGQRPWLALTRGPNDDDLRCSSVASRDALIEMFLRRSPRKEQCLNA